MKILLTLDGSEFAEAAIPVARRLAIMPDVEVHVLTVVEPGAPVALRRDNGEPALARARWYGMEDREDDSLEFLPLDVEMVLTHYVQSVARQFPNQVVAPVVRVGRYPAEQLVAYAEANGIDLVVMATHGRSGINQLLHGSVAARVLRAAVAPVVLVRPTPVALMAPATGARPASEQVRSGPVS